MDALSFTQVFKFMISSLLLSAVQEPPAITTRPRIRHAKSVSEMLLGG